MSGPARAVRRLLAAALALTAAVSAAACGAPAGRPLPPRATPSVAAPRPPGAADPASVPSTTASPGADCDARASLRPAGPLPPPGRPPANSTMAAIVARGRLVVGVDQNTYLFGFRDPFTGQLTGFDIDIAREVATALFGNPDAVQFKAISSAERIPAIQRNEVDLVVRTFTMTCERWEQVAFSTEYFTAGQRVLVTGDSTVRGIADLGGKKVCAAAGSTSIRAVAAHPSRPVPVSVVDWTDCLVMLQQGQVDAISTDDSILAGLKAQDPNTEVVGERFTDEPYGIAAAKPASDLIRFVNAVLDRLRSSGRWSQIYQRWLSELGPVPAPPVARYRD